MINLISNSVIFVLQTLGFYPQPPVSIRCSLEKMYMGGGVYIQVSCVLFLACLWDRGPSLIY